MGFELLPIEDGDEDRYAIFTITSPEKLDDIEKREVIVIKEDLDVSIAHEEFNSEMDTSKLQVPTTGVTTRSKGKLKLRSKIQPCKDAVYQESPDSGEASNP